MEVDLVTCGKFRFRVIEAVLVEGDVRRLVECELCRCIILEDQLEQHVDLHPEDDDIAASQREQMEMMAAMNVKHPNESREEDPTKRMLVEKAESIRDYILDTKGECCTEDVYLELLKLHPEEMALYDKRWIGFLFRGPKWKKNGNVRTGGKHPMNYWERVE